jgi:RimJ/RimL family protein N-acetyltransferase
MEEVVLSGAHIRLEPLGNRHLDGLTAAATGNGELFQWSLVPKNADEMKRYVETALAWKDAGTALPFAIVRNADDAVIGSTRFWQIEWWAWPKGHVYYGRELPDVCEIGHTWLTCSAIRTAANTESKSLMLTYAFETWKVLRVCLHTDARNARSCAAIERIGGRFEGILRAHRMAADYTPRNSARFSILADEWPVVKVKLKELGARH